jgi:hypothetical protein
MESHQWIHPVVGVTAVGLLATTAWSKLRAIKYRRLHYALGLSTMAAMIGVVVLGLYTVIRVLDDCDCEDAFPGVLFAARCTSCPALPPVSSGTGDDGSE